MLLLSSAQAKIIFLQRYEFQWSYVERGIKAKVKLMLTPLNFQHFVRPCIPSKLLVDQPSYLEVSSK